VTISVENAEGPESFEHLFNSISYCDLEIGTSQIEIELNLVLFSIFICSFIIIEIRYEWLWA